TFHPRPELQSSYVAPRNEIEQAISECWQRLLGIEQVGAEDNFFELGGHSLLATQFLSWMRDHLRVELSLRDLFEAPTAAGLTERIELARQMELDPQSAPIARVPLTEDVPLSFAQERLWFIHQLEPESPTYNIPGAVRLTGLLQVSALERSLNEIIRR